MKILWIVNTVFPAPSKEMGLPIPVVGGWMYGLAEQICKSSEVELAVATTYTGNELLIKKIDGIVYYLLPCKNKIKYDVALEQFWERVNDEFSPNVVHIHGTEFAHGLSCMRKLPQLNYVVSIQGLVGVYSRYYYAGISFAEIVKNITFRDIVKSDSIFQAKRVFDKRGGFEKEYIERTKNVIGRTKWDYAHTKFINSNVDYHFCNESLRDNFYSASKWSIEYCVPYTIFLSQAGYPIKGLHQVIKAVAVLKKTYPNITIRLGGGDITKRQTLRDKIVRSGYGKYVSSLLIKYKLVNNIFFLGVLSEDEMIKEYQKANVFICPSSIENSPNSLGEAQLLGVPTISAYVGGVPDMVEDDKTGLLYRFEEVEMLAERIRSVFNDNKLVLKLSENGIEAAEKRHDRMVNSERTMEIYYNIGLSVK